MFGLAQGVSRVESVLPGPVYALLSGLNAATVGLIALAGVQLSTRTITDKITRTILIGAACAGLLYTALWYFPVLIVIGALLAIVWDLWLREKFELLRNHVNERRGIASQPPAQAREEGVQRESLETEVVIMDRDENEAKEAQEVAPSEHESAPPTQISGSPRRGVAIIIAFFAVFITFMVLRPTIDAPVDLRLFTNLFLAGTIIFGGGPVVIPLLREYVVAEGWVTSRDFLIGLAIIQAFPGPNFNCESCPSSITLKPINNTRDDSLTSTTVLHYHYTVAVYLSALASKYTACPPAVTALLGFLGIFSPGIVLATGFQSLWRHVREWRTIQSALRGINAAAVGLIWTAVYRLWEIGYLRQGSGTGTSLGQEPWFVVIAALAFSGAQWYSIPAPVTIVVGGVLGLVRFAIVGRN